MGISRLFLGGGGLGEYHFPGGGKNILQSILCTTTTKKIAAIVDRSLIQLVAIRRWSLAQVWLYLPKNNKKRVFSLKSVKTYFKYFWPASKGEGAKSPHAPLRKAMTKLILFSNLRFKKTRKKKTSASIYVWNETCLQSSVFETIFRRKYDEERL